jgi:hypothetical protein
MSIPLSPKLEIMMKAGLFEVIVEVLWIGCPGGRCAGMGVTRYEFSVEVT